MPHDLARFIDRWTIEFVRNLPHPPERVWTAVTDPAELGVWFYGPAEIDLHVGGAWALGGPGSDFRGAVLAVEPPRLVRYGGPHPGPDSWWEFNLSPAGVGTRVVFVQHIGPASWNNPHNWAADPPDHPAGAANPWRPGTLSGWHGALDHLEDLLAGAALRRLDMAGMDERYREHMRATQP